jgi:small nuclear ribonucleoprotein D3
MCPYIMPSNPVNLSHESHNTLLFMIVTMTARDGRVSRLEHVFVRGGNIKFIVLPDLLKNAPIFKKVQTMRAKKVGDAGPAGGRGGPGRGGGRGGRGRGGRK